MSLRTERESPCSSPRKREDLHYLAIILKEDLHYLAIILKEDNDKAAVSRARCSCKGGSGGHCNHVLALLYQLNDYSCLGIQDIPVMYSITRQSYRI